jgi:hypothetical protein
MTRQHLHNRFAALCFGLLAMSLLQGCGIAGGASVLSSSVGSVTASGVERTLDGAAIQTITEPQDRIVGAAERALIKMGFDIGNKIRSERHIRIEARSVRRNVVITIEAVARHASQIRIEVNSGWLLSEDPTTATEIIEQISVALGSAK